MKYIKILTGGEMFNNVADTGIGDFPYTSDITNRNNFSVKALIWMVNERRCSIYTLSSNESKEIGTDNYYTKLAVMKVE